MNESYGCKVCRVLDARGLDQYDERLLSEWRGESGQRKGYRQLARWLNITLVRREMDAVGLPTLGDEAESKYDRLRGEDTNAIEMRNMLAGEGVDVEGLERDFVSYGVVRTHLTDCLDASYDPPEPSEWEPDTISIARDHALEKIRGAVSSLANKGELDTGGSVSVTLDVELECESCQTRIPLSRALRRGRVCQCDAAAAEVTADV